MPALWSLGSLILFCAFASAAPIVFTQPPAKWQPTSDFGVGARIVVLRGNAVSVLTPSFHSAADPDVSWDGKRILFAARKTAASPWQIYEMRADGTGVRQVVKTPWDCRNPIYQSKIFYLDDVEAQPQITFVAKAGTAVRHLFSARLDGTGLRQLTFNLHDDLDPFLNEDGRILYSAGNEKGAALFGVNLDGTDVSLFAAEEGRPRKRMPSRTEDRMIAFIESASNEEWDGAGNLAAVDLRRNLHSYREWTRPGSALYAWPSPLRDGAILVSRREPGKPHAIYRFDPKSGREQLVYRGPGHALQPKELAARPMPDGRASVVDEKEPTGQLYCLSVLDSDRPEIAARAAKVRVVDAAANQVVGEAPVARDGSFLLQLPANWAFRVELADANGKTLRRSAPFWVKNKEHRGCIGCHEDRERTPENRFAEALGKPPAAIHPTTNGPSGGTR